LLSEDALQPFVPMKTKIKSGIFTLFFALQMFALSALGASTGVTLTSDVQAVIDAAAPGDTLFMETGVYESPLVFNKALKVVPSAGPNQGQIQFTGSVTIQNTGTNSFQQTFFGGPVETIGATVTILDSMHNAPILARNGKLIMKRVLLSTLASLTLTNSAGFEGLRIKSLAPIKAHAPTTTPGQFMAVQSEFQSSLTFINSKVWLGYNTAYGASQISMTGSDAVLIGNRLTVSHGDWQLVVAGGNLKMINNLMVNPGGHGITLSGTGADLINNTIIPNIYTLNVDSAVRPINLRANIFRGHPSYPPLVVSANSSALIFASYCLFFGSVSPQSLIVPPFVNCLINVDPMLSADKLTLTAESPCIGKGMPGAVHNNRDGTANTIGYTGGPYLNTANYTNDNPMVFLLTGPQAILKGGQTTIPISAAASAGH
jgi:hypothetical protein